MRVRPSVIALGLFLPTLLAVCGRAHETSHALPADRVPLLSHVVLHSAILTLADLLPSSAPASLRDRARKISLGAAPQPPMTRTLYRQQLQLLLQDKALLRELRLPDEIIIQRSFHVITKQEVINAIHQALGNEALGGKNGIGLQDLQFSTAIYATRDDPGLEVIRIASDPLRHATRFRLWTSKEPNSLPFTVTAPQLVRLPVVIARRMMAGGEIVSATDFAVVMKPATERHSSGTSAPSALAGLETRFPLHAGQPIDPHNFAPAVLVESGTLATLIVEGSGFQIKTIVTAMEGGRLGQEIRVRNTETRQVVEAKVIGRDTLLKTR